MAKVKQIKSMQERLEEAIVPKEQAPFAIPENWCWVKLFYLCQLENGEKVFGDCLPYLDAKYLRGKSEGALKSEGVLLEKGQKVILVDGENSGEVFEIFERGYMGSTFRVLSINKNVNVDLIQYFISFYQEELRNNKIGSAIPHLNKELFYNLSFPYAPIEEQKRIVDKIESLFSRLDEAKELILNSLDEFEDRKSTILHKAFNGELTACYRKQNEISWKNCVLNDVADYKKGPFGSSITKAMFVEKGESTYKVYEQGNAIRKTINYGRYYISEKKFQELKSFEVKGGDIIVSCAGTIGETFMLPENCERGIINQALMRVRLYDNIVPQYFIYYFGEVLKQDVNSKAKGIAIKNIPRFSVLKQLPIKLPPLQEQQEIVRILDGFFEKEDKSKESLDMIDQIEEMKKSILARAFRGELGTHSDTDEPAIELLRKILK